MRYYFITLQDFLTKNKNSFPTQEALKQFKQSLKSYVANIADSKKESEEHQKNILSSFLSKTFDYSCNTRNKIDLAIYEDSTPKVLFEVKSLSNEGEFIGGRGRQNTLDKSTKDTNSNISLESKAFYESILYFLREFITYKNNNITYIILTNTQKFYCIDAQEYMQFAKHKEIVKAFKNCEKKGGNDTSTKRFYETLKFLLPTINSTLKCTYFCLDESLLDSNLIYHTAPSSHFESFSCHSEALAKDFQTMESKINKYQTSLALIYQAISPSTLLKHKACIDSNTLNQSFYNELLYILGLEEKMQNSKVIIEPSHTPNTLLDSACLEFKLSRDKDFETLFTLLTTWNNRLLFLRLLESMLLGFKHTLKPFLDLETLKDFPALSTLFFDVLAKVEESRSKSLTESLQVIPYLNSSLFEETPLENEGKHIGSLKSKPLTIYADSILYKDEQIRKDLNLKGKDSTLPLLEYLFAFLHAYDFTTTSNDIQNRIKINYDKLINAAVLGLVFEKLNGYKDGSFYTPSFITRYMCKQSLEKVVLEKFNSVKNWQCADLESLKTKLDKLTNSKEDYKQANAIFDSIKICDPSVGSGHFLVSALNELILLKFQLGILCDENYSRIKDISLEILHDEIVIRDSNNALFTYTLPAHENIESHKIQRALFHNKRILIESCIFGVDINPNSCEITKLRLWIELLKYSYYKDIANKRLETLPNIDINIKCGNSLVSYMPISEPLHIDIKEKIKDYQKLESDYFHCFYTDKQQHQKKIDNTKQELLNKFFMRKYYKELKELRKKCDEYSKNYEKYGIDKLSEHYEFLKNNVTTVSFFPQINEIKEEKAQKALENLKKEHNKIFSLERNFEWRIEFSKLLDNGLTQEQIASNNTNKRKGNSRNLHKNKQGDFLGFDLIIGNPPYIRQEEIKELKPHLQKSFIIYKGMSDIYTYFFEQGYKILKNNGILSFITSNKWCRAGYGEALRGFLLENTSILNYIDLNGVKVFESASVDTSILQFAKAKAKPKHTLNYANPKDYNTKENEHLEESLELTQIPQDSLSIDSFIFTSPEIAALKAKIEKIGTPLKDWDINIYRGILTGYNEAFIIDSKKREEILNACANEEERARTKELIKPILRGRDIKRYSYEWDNKWLIFISWHFPNTQNPKSMQENEKDLEEQYPSLYNHLLQYKDRLSKRNKDETGIRYEWYCLQRWGANYYQEFAKPKIVYSEIVREPQFYLDNGEFKFGYFYAEATSFILSGNKNFKSSLEYLLGLLHSKLCTFAFKEFYAGGGLGESGYRYKKAFLENLPIPRLEKAKETEFAKIVNEIIECKKSLGDRDNKNTRSLRGAEIVEKGGSSVSARLELEANKRGSPLDFQKSGVFFGAKGSGDGINPFLRKEKDSNNKEELQELESRLDSLVFSLYNLSNEEIELISNKIVGGGGVIYSLSLLLLSCVESQCLNLLKLLCENFELELKEAFRFCKGLQVPKRKYEGKIVYPNMAKEFIAYLDNKGFFTNQKCFILTDKCKDKNRLLYLTAVLNSKTNFWYFKHIGATLGTNGYEMSKIFVERLPVIETHKIDSKLLTEIENLASEILESREIDSNSNTAKLESHLDSLIYQVYGLNENEIDLIESTFAASGWGGWIDAYLKAFINLFTSQNKIDFNATSTYQGKILYPCIMANESCFVYEEKGFFAPAPTNLITGKEYDMKYLTGLLNSKAIYFAMRQFYMGGGIDGELKTNNLLKIPIPKIDSKNQKIVNKIIALVDEILKLLKLKAKDSSLDTNSLESKIDNLVYKLYNLTEEEIKIINK